jgi:hypothetical protein
MNDRFLMLQRQPRRITITLSYNVHEALLDRSEEEGRSVSNLCAFLLEESLRHSQGMPKAGSGMPQERRQERQPPWKSNCVARLILEMWGEFVR